MPHFTEVISKRHADEFMICYTEHSVPIVRQHLPLKTPNTAGGALKNSYHPLTTQLNEVVS